MALPQHTDDKLSPEVMQAGIGEASALTLFTRLRRTGLFPPTADDPFALALCAMALRLQPALSVHRFIDCLPVSAGALDEVDLCNALARLGYNAAELSLVPAEIDPRLGPCLLFDPQKSGAAALMGMLYFDQADTHRLRPWFLDIESCEAGPLNDADPRLKQKGRLLAFRPPQDGGPIDAPSFRRARGQGWFRSLLVRQKATITTIMMLGFGLNLMALSMPIFIMLMYDQVIGPRAVDPFVSISIGAGLVVAAEALLRMLRSRALSWFTARLDFLVGLGLFEKLMTLPPRLIEQMPTSAHIARIRTFESVRDFFSGPVLISALELPATVLALLAISILAGPLALVTLSTAVIYTIVFFLMRRRVAVAIEEAALESSAAQRFSLETFQKAQSIRLDGLTEKWSEKFRDLSGTAMAAQYRLKTLGQTGEVLGNLIGGLAVLCTLWVGTHMIWDGQLTIGALIAVAMLTWRAVAPFHSLLSMLPRFEQSRNSILQINRFMDADIEEFEYTGDVPAPDLKGAIEFSAVALRYSAAAGPVFAGLSFSASPGQLIAITGPNGSGKSSVLKLAAGLQLPLVGAVRLDGLDARQLNPRDLRRRIAYVPQEVAIFRGTVAENLQFVNRLAEEDELWAALDAVGAGGDIEAMPDGLETVLDPVQGQVNELLVQRIGLARAVLQNTKLLLIDERPAAMLRAGIDQDLKRMLGRLRGTRTVLITTHRPDFLRLADKAIALRPGLPPVVGSPDKIMELDV